MNKQLKQLVINARDAFINGVTETNGEIYIHGSDKNLEKFAELIVKECAKIADDGCGSACFGLGINGAMLKHHFGLKE